MEDTLARVPLPLQLSTMRFIIGLVAGLALISALAAAEESGFYQRLAKMGQAVKASYSSRLPHAEAKAFNLTTRDGTTLWTVFLDLHKHVVGVEARPLKPGSLGPFSWPLIASLCRDGTTAPTVLIRSPYGPDGTENLADLFTPFGLVGSMAGRMRLTVWENAGRVAAALSRVCGRRAEPTRDGPERRCVACPCALHRPPPVGRLWGTSARLGQATLPSGLPARRMSKTPCSGFAARWVGCSGLLCVDGGGRHGAKLIRGERVCVCVCVCVSSVCLSVCLCLSVCVCRFRVASPGAMVWSTSWAPAPTASTPSWPCASLRSWQPSGSSSLLGKATR